MSVLSPGYREYREVIIFGRETNQSLFAEQMKIFSENKSGLEDRDIKVTVVEAGDHYAKTYKVEAGVFTFVLVGKDGTEKYRSEKLVTTDKLFSLIDAMPMRKREMRNDN